MKRELKVGMRFLLPITITRVFSDGSFFMRTDGWPESDSRSSISPRDIDGLIPEGGWPREPFKHGDVVRRTQASRDKIGTKVILQWEVWGPEVDGKIMIHRERYPRLADAADFELVPK